MARVAAFVALLGFSIGLGLGMYLGWVVSPVDYVDTDPTSLRPAYKDDYVLMIAQIYAETGDVALARARLAALSYGAPGDVVASVGQRLAAQAPPPEHAETRRNDLHALAQLANALGQLPPELQPYLP